MGAESIIFLVMQSVKKRHEFPAPLLQLLLRRVVPHGRRGHRMTDTLGGNKFGLPKKPLNRHLNGRQKKMSAAAQIYFESKEHKNTLFEAWVHKNDKATQASCCRSPVWGWACMAATSKSIPPPAPIAT